jgi:NADH-quinone oxidoreductase subunit G
MRFISIFLDGQRYFVPENLTILEACEFINKTIPHFCYHEKLLISGSCRMCVVEIKDVEKPIISCATVISKDMKIFLNTPMVQKVRENVLEFLLLNHPLDCPICDQGGECDLQDLSIVFGSDKSRFFQNKRSVSDKSFNFVIKSIMTRCIHCTRCLRFSTDVVGNGFLGIVGRGISSEISSYVFDGVFDSELSGNTIDLCPVGALTSKLYSFRSRSWELRVIKSVDIFDSMVIPIKVFFKDTEILRIFPLKTFEINNIWISDRVRFCYDGLNVQRLDIPLIKVGNQFIKSSWKQCFYVIRKKILKGSITGFYGEHVNLNDLFIFKHFLNSIGSSNLEIDNNNSLILSDFTNTYKLNTSVKLYKFTDVVLLIGVDTRFDSSSLNLKLREAYIQKIDFACFSIGKPLSLTFKNVQLGWNFNIFLQVVLGKHRISKIIFLSKYPKFLLGSYLSNFKIYKKLNSYLNKNLDISLLNINVTSISSSFLGFSSVFNNNYSLVLRSSTIYFLNSSLSNFFNCSQNKFLIFQGSLGNSDLILFNIILPTFSFLEKKNIYLNNEGIFTKTEKVGKFFKNIREDFVIFISLYKYLFGSFLCNSNINIKKFMTLSLSNTLYIYDKYIFENFYIKNIEKHINNFYLTSNILKTSLTMRKCSKTIFIHRYGYKFYYNSN